MAAQAGLCLACSEITEDTFCRVVAHILLRYRNIQIEYVKKRSANVKINEPRHDKTNKVTVRHAKPKRSLG